MSGIPHDHYEPKSGAEKWLHKRLNVVGLVYDTIMIPTPKNLNWMWIWGIVLTFCLVLQIATGVVLAMHYTPHVDLAFASIEHIMRDVRGDHMIRYMHMNGAALFFFAVYVHIFRGLYYGSYKAPRENTWIILANDQIIGSISIISLENSSSLFRPSSQRTLADKDVACLRLMYVNPNYLRQGFGSQLINVAIRFMRDCQYQLGVLITHAANSRARRFYEKNGWVLDRIFDDQVEEFYKDPPAMRLRARYHFPL